MTDHREPSPSSIRPRVLRGEVLTGTVLNLGSALTAEIAGCAGLDWVMIDLEHGAGDHESLVHQLQALAGTATAPIVRVAWNEPPRFKRVLDLGAAGVMVPYVNTELEARQAVAATRYPPQGVRGLARSTRATRFGQSAGEYLAHANAQLLTVLQIETAEAVAHADAIAAVDGADVLFIGPADLTLNLGIPQELDHPRFREAVRAVVTACRAAHKAAGVLVGTPEQVAQAIADGFTFVGVGTESSLIMGQFQELVAAGSRFRRRPEEGR